MRIKQDQKRISATIAPAPAATVDHSRRRAVAALAGGGALGTQAALAGIASLAALAGTTAPTTARAATATTWPGGRPITVVVPFTPGGNVDTTARLVADRLGPRLDQSVIVDNQPGAGGVLGAGKVAAAAPDGHTLLMGFEGPIAIAAAVNPGAVRFDPARDLVPVAAVTTAPMVIVTRPDFPASTMADLIALARQSPGRLGYATSGIGTVLHLTMEIVRERADIDLAHVPYKGGAQIVSDVLGGHVDLAILVSTSVVPQIQAGKLKALAVTTAKRLEALPAVPALAETPALKDIDITTWTGLFVPAGTPESIVTRLNAETAAVLAEPTIAERLRAGGASPGRGSAADFSRFVQEDRARFARIIDSTGIRQ